MTAPRIGLGDEGLFRGHRRVGRARLLLSALIAAAANVAAAPDVGVLIIHSNQRPTPAAIVVDDTLRALVPTSFGKPVEIFSEYLDDEWSSKSDYRNETLAFLGHRYADRNVRVIVTSAPQALEFGILFRDHSLLGVPIVAVALPQDQRDRANLPAGVVGRTVDLDPAPTLNLARHLQPDARRLVVILGAAERDRVWERRIRSAVDRTADGLEVEYLSGLTTNEVLRRVGALPRGTIVYTPGYFVDGSGEVVTPRQSVEAIAKASSAPVYGPLDTFVGTGEVGGYVTPYVDQAKEAAGLITRLLNGAAPAEIENGSVAQVPMVDWRQIDHWHIDQRLLPPDTVVEFRDPTIWDRYRIEISIGIAVLLLQAVLIAALLVERRIRRRTASALEESQQQMSIAARAAGLTSWIWDTARNVVKAPPRSLRSTGPSQPPIPFDDVMGSVHPADRENLKRAVGRAQRTGQELDVEYRVVVPDGGARWIVVRGRAEEQQPNRLLGIALDITERKAADLRAVEDRAALRHMTRVSTMGQLSAAIAHQLNQPLAAILGNAEAAQKMLSREQLDLAELREICRDIISEDHRATAIIRRLDELYRRGDIQTEPLDLNELTRETLDLLRSELLIRHVAPLTEFAPALPAIDGGHTQLQQVLLNLLINATDALNAINPEERKLTLRTEAHDGEVRLLVKDNGPGISAEHLKSVFDPFWSTKDGGMGMGLAICRSIVLAHRGGITAANNAEGGATICVSLPALGAGRP